MDIENIFTYHKPNDDQIARYELIRSSAKSLAHVIKGQTPVSAEQTIALRKLQECVMFANAAIAVNEVT